MEQTDPLQAGCSGGGGGGVGSLPGSFLDFSRLENQVHTLSLIQGKGAAKRWNMKRMYNSTSTRMN